MIPFFQVSGEENSRESSLSAGEETNKTSNVDHLSSEVELPASKSVEGSINKPKRKLFVSPKNTVRKQKINEDPRITQAYNILDTVANKPRDECSTFGEHISTKLRKFNERQRNILMHKINTLIFEAEMEIYTYPQYIDSSVSSPASSFVRTPQYTPDPLNTVIDPQTQPDQISPSLPISPTHQEQGQFQELSTVQSSICLQQYVNTFLPQ